VGLAKRPSQEVLRRDLAPVLTRIAELVGPDWIAELLSAALPEVESRKAKVEN
jgi:hypothetical protein